MNQSLKDYVWVFVGCGGTFYAASPYLAVLRRRYAGEETILFDPGVIKEGNQNRQWPGYEGTSKVTMADLALSCGETIGLMDPFSSSDPLLEDRTDGRPVLAIVNVDNDQARLAVADWLASRVSSGIMVVSGCERTFGQCYPGMWIGGQVIHDWRDYHKDVGQDGPNAHRCNQQDVRANALTGVCVGLCVEDIARRVEEGTWSRVSEYYWNTATKGEPSMWHEELLCRGGSNYG